MNPVYTWARAEGSNMPAAALGTMNLLAPLQAAMKARQEATGPIGFLNGALDGKAICDKLVALIITGELKIGPDAIANVYLDVASGNQISPDYWAGWASSVNGRIATNFVQAVKPSTVTLRNSAQFYAPFFPCICCDFPNTGGTYQPDPNVVTCLTNAANQFSSMSIRCWGFWAKAVDNATYRVPTPALNWTIFSDFNQPIGNPKENLTVPVSVLLWRYADYRSTDNTFAGGEKLSADASNDNKWGQACMLKMQTWQLPNTPANFVSWGADVSNTAITAAALAGLPNDTVDGNNIDFLGSYYRPSGYHNLITSSTVTTLGAAGIRFSPFFEDGQAALQAGYYTQAQGLSDGTDAFGYANTLGQPANTPVYFVFDDPPVFHPVTNGADALTIDGYFGGIQQAYLTYLANNAPDPTPYAIGVYADLNNVEILNYCYSKGYASYFWYAYYVASGPINLATIAQDVTNNMPWVHSNAWQYGTNYALPNSGLSVDKNTSWRDEGAWSW